MKIFDKNSILFNAVLICVVGLALIYISLFAIDLFTGHGDYKRVPDLRNLPLREAIAKLDDAGFKWEIIDSTYNDSYKPGVIIDQEPKANTNVKPIRTIYLTMNAMYPKLVTIPALTDMSYRQGKAMLEGLGFKKFRVDTVESPYKELIIAVLANGKQIEAGTKVPLSAQIVLKIGDGSEDTPEDSLPVQQDDPFGGAGIVNGDEDTDL